MIAVARRNRAAWVALAFGLSSPAALAQTPVLNPPGAAAPRGAPTAAAGAPAPTSAAAGATAPTAPAGASAMPAEPDDATAKSNALRRKGNEAAKMGRYGEAIANYEEAIRLSPQPKTYYNIAAAYEKLERYSEALDALVRVRSSPSPEGLTAAQLQGLDARVEALRQRVATLKVRANVAGARVLVRDTIVGTQPVDRPLEVSLNEGRATIEILQDGYKPYRKEHTLKGGSLLELEVQLNREAPPTIVGEKTRTVYITSTPFWSQWWFWAGAGALVLGGAATIYALSTEKDPSRSSFGPEQIVTAGRPGVGLRF